MIGWTLKCLPLGKSEPSDSEESEDLTGDEEWLETER